MPVLYFRCLACDHRFDLTDPSPSPECPRCGSDCRLYGVAITAAEEDEADEDLDAGGTRYEALRC